MGACVIDIRRHTGYFGAGGAQGWADEWKAWVRGEVENIERGLKVYDLEVVANAVAALVYYGRPARHWGEGDERLLRVWEVERDALAAIGADDLLAFVVYWARNRDVIIRDIYTLLSDHAATLLIRELYDKGLRMRDIDEQVVAWRPFDAELDLRSRCHIGITSMDQAAALRLQLTRSGRLWKPDAAAMDQMNAPT